MIEQGLVVEPLKELYKDEVRELGLSLGLPTSIINRHPFPGPGLAIRCLCSAETKNERPVEITMPYLPDEIKIYKLPIKSVGVQGDERSYAHPAVIINRTYNRDWEYYQRISPQITNQHKDIDRVLVLMGGGDETKLLNSFIWKAGINKARLDLLRAIDGDINQLLNDQNYNDKIWQFPIILAPFGYQHGESIILRPVESKEAMTVSFAILPSGENDQPDILTTCLDVAEHDKKIDFIFYDITNKPPGTIEWE
jgi:GMP synthase (glutamine-hydrolysing)